MGSRWSPPAPKMWSNCGEWVSTKTLSWASSGHSAAAVRMLLILNEMWLSSIVSAQRHNEGTLISDCHRFSSFNKLTMPVQFTVTSMCWNPPRWPSLWWSLSRPESFRCLVAELIRWSSQTTREVRLECSWVQAHVFKKLFKCTVILFNLPSFIWYLLILFPL